MHIEKLSLINFKNYEELTLDFSTKINCIVGTNGSGKTNLLDAIFYLSSTKSAINTVDSQNVKFDQNFFSLRGHFSLEGQEYTVGCGFKEGGKKIFKVNSKEYDKLREHVGRFPAIFIAPNDTDLIRDGSEIRRKFFDMVISQSDGEYLSTLIKYNFHLKNRNSLLKRFAETQRVDRALLEPYDMGILSLGQVIHSKRRAFLQLFEETFLKEYKQLSRDSEPVSIQYDSDYNKESFETRYKNAERKDVLLQRTTLGVHKDDFKFLIGDNPIKKFGSQGQQKSFILALKLSHFLVLKKLKGFKPVLLLDDIFDKLDPLRIEKLIEIISGKEFGQVFITDARQDRAEEILRSTHTEAQIFHIKGGTLIN